MVNIPAVGVLVEQDEVQGDVEGVAVTVVTARKRTDPVVLDADAKPSVSPMRGG